MPVGVPSGARIPEWLSDRYAIRTRNLHGRLDDGEADGADAEDGDGRSGRHFCRVEDGAEARRNAAAEERRLVGKFCSEDRRVYWTTGLARL